MQVVVVVLASSKHYLFAPKVRLALALYLSATRLKLRGDLCICVFVCGLVATNVYVVVCVDA